MELFKEKQFLIFYLRSRTRSPRDFVETPGSRSWKGGEEGGLERVAIVAHWWWHVGPMSRPISSAFVAISEAFLCRHFYRVSHTSSIEGLAFADLISWDLCRVFMFIFVLK
ncbi:hypothetical protein L484_009704 [Morus notabilis]|uniref:Uncharacterized protein n=1 Tax=Morus notabilis TaxID=981085 RepID=W9SUJ4_9ROSA|nr:hypothetical protein L484_009704 [Morus notabilis]